MEAEGVLTPSDRASLTYMWSAFAATISLMYLSVPFGKSLLIGFFILTSCFLGVGKRWLVGGSFALSVLALALMCGFPPPAEWPELIRSGLQLAGSMHQAMAQ